MHAAEHRALRELWAFTRQLARHWSSLAANLPAEDAAALRSGAEEARALLAELEPAMEARGLPVRPAAQATGRLVSARPPVTDRVLERNQALRFAVLDVQHCVTLLGYLRALAAARGDEELGGLEVRWERRLAAHERTVRAAAIAVGERPDEAITAADPSPVGRAGQRVAATLGAVGEWVDRQAARRTGS